MGCGLIVPPFSQQSDAVSIRHPDVEKHQIGRVTGIPSSRFGCVGGDRYLIPFVLENIADDLPNIRFVVNNQNLVGSHGAKESKAESIIADAAVAKL